MLLDKQMMKMLGDAVLLSSIQFAIGSVEMSSKFSVRNFSSNQKTLDSAIEALREYMKIALFWTIGTVMLLYGTYGKKGAIAAIAANIAIMGWIWISYQKCFKQAAELNGLQVPQTKLFGLF